MNSGNLQKSIDQYRLIIEHAQQLKQLLSKGEPERLHQYITRLNELQAAAEFNDRDLLEELTRDPDRWHAHPLFLQRRRLLEQVVEMNSGQLLVAQGMTSVIAAELTELKGGRQAVSGYGAAFKKNYISSRGKG